MAIDRASYLSWIERYDTLGDRDLVLARRFLDSLQRRPRIDVVMPVYDTPEPFLGHAIDSVRNQIYPDWTLCIFDDCSTSPYVAATLERASREDPRIRVARAGANGGIAAATNGALGLGDAELVTFLDHDDVLPPHALLLIAHTLEQHPDANLITGDVDLLDATGERMSPLFKPDYDHDLLLGLNVVWGSFRRSLLEELGGMRLGYPGSEDHDLSLRAVERAPAATIHHIPHIVYHWRMVQSSFSHTRLGTAIDSAQRALREHCERIGVPSTVAPAPKTLAWHRVRAQQDPAPRGTLIIEGAEAAELDELRARYAATSGLEGWTFELGRPPPGPVGEARNRVAQRTSSELLAFVDARLTPENADWLTEMASHFAYPGCAAVGARIFAADGSVEQCGVLLGVRERPGAFPVARVLHGAARDDTGYLGRAELCHGTSAVTGGVLLARRASLLELAGFDEQLSDPYAVDVDFSLRARKRGFSLVTCPHATFRAARPARWFEDPESALLLQRRWAAQLTTDPYYNPNLTDSGTPFELAFPPRVCFPWRAR